MASPSKVSELVAKLEEQSIASDGESDQSSEISLTPSTDTHTTNTPTTPNTPNRVFNAPTQCFGLQTHKTKGLFLCAKPPRSEHQFAFCGKTHQTQFNNVFHGELKQLFYCLVGFINTKRPDLLDEFRDEVAPHFTVTIAKYKGKPAYYEFKSEEEYVLFSHDTKNNTVRNLKAFYRKVKEELRQYMLDVAVITGSGDPDIRLRDWDLALERLREPDFSDVRFNYFITA